MIRIFLAATALTLGLGLSAAAHDETPAAEAEHHDDAIKLTPAQIEAGNFGVADVRGGELSKRIRVPGAIIPSGDRIARVAVRLLGTVAELRKRLGDRVEAGEVVAVIESREVADAKSEYLGGAAGVRPAADPVRPVDQAVRGQGAQRERLPARADDVRGCAREDRDGAAEAVRARPDGRADRGAAAAAGRDACAGRSCGRRSPAGSPNGASTSARWSAGRARKANSTSSSISTVVWVDLAVPPADWRISRKGRTSRSRQARADPSPATIMFVSPLLDKDTRAARVVASVDNAAGKWRPGASSRRTSRSTRTVADAGRAERRAADDQGRARGVRAQRRRLRGAQGQRRAPRRPRSSKSLSGLIGGRTHRHHQHLHPQGRARQGRSRAPDD